MEKLIFQSYEQKYKSELNSWHSKEYSFNENGLSQFIVPESILLGDYIEFIDENMKNTTNMLIFDSNQLIGFLGYDKPQENHIHIEYVGVNPDKRGKGYAKTILEQFKTEINTRNPQINITLEVNKANSAGLKSFSKIAKQAETQEIEGYVQFKL